MSTVPAGSRGCEYPGSTHKESEGWRRTPIRNTSQSDDWRKTHPRLRSTKQRSRSLLMEGELLSSVQKTWMSPTSHGSSTTILSITIARIVWSSPSTSNTSQVQRSDLHSLAFCCDYGSMQLPSVGTSVLCSIRSVSCQTISHCCGSTGKTAEGEATRCISEAGLAIWYNNGSYNGSYTLVDTFATWTSQAWPTSSPSFSSLVTQ